MRLHDCCSADKLLQWGQRAAADGHEANYVQIMCKLCAEDACADLCMLTHGGLQTASAGTTTFSLWLPQAQRAFVACMHTCTTCRGFTQLKALRQVCGCRVCLPALWPAAATGSSAARASGLARSGGRGMRAMAR